MFYQFEHFGTAEHFRKETGKNFSFPMHMHSSFELIIIQSGHMDISIGTQKYSLKKNEAVLVFPHQLHSLHSSQSEHVLYIFSPDIIKSFSSKVTQKIPENNKMIIDEHLLTLLYRVEENSSMIEKKGVLYSICAEFDKANGYIDRSSGKSDLLLSIFEFIESEYDKECLLKELSDKLSYDYSYISRYFKRNVGISFNEYVNNYRVSKACDMLSNTDCTVLQCALECGYKSLRSFNRAFKSILSVTPSEYRKMK